MFAQCLKLFVFFVLFFTAEIWCRSQNCRYLYI